MPHRPGTVLSRFVDSVLREDLAGLAAEIAYRFLFAVFPFGLFLAALGAFVAGWLGVDNPAGQAVEALGDNLPPDLGRALQPELERVIGTARPGLLTIGALGALWAATGGTNALIKAMNRSYDVEETRPIAVRWLLAIGLTLLAGAAILVAFVTVIGGAIVTDTVAERLGLSGPAVTLVTLLRWPGAFVILVGAVAVLYRMAPNLRVAWRWALLGAALFAVGWLVATWGFAWYIGSNGGYGSMYGALGGVIVLMSWFYITALLLVGAATLTAVTASVVEPESLQRRRDEILAERRVRAAAESAKRAAKRAVEVVEETTGIRRRRETESPRATAESPAGQSRDRRSGPIDRRGVGYGSSGPG